MSEWQQIVNATPPPSTQSSQNSSFWHCSSCLHSTRWVICIIGRSRNSDAIHPSRFGYKLNLPLNKISSNVIMCSGKLALPQPQIRSIDNWKPLSSARRGLTTLDLSHRVFSDFHKPFSTSLTSLICNRASHSGGQCSRWLELGGDSLSRAC